MTSPASTADHQVSKVAVIGAGQMGGGIAQISAIAGFETVVRDTSADQLGKCKALHAKLMARAVEKGRMEQGDADAALARITYAEDAAAMDGADIAIEAVTENAAVKASIFADLDAQFADSPNTILATNTSSISITQIGAATKNPGRVIGMHFFYPVPVMKLVEVINGLATDQGVTDRVLALSTAMGKVAVPANDRAGFVSNRILMPMINEAFYTWMEGVAEPEHIDQIMTLGMAHPMGPLRLADFIGLDTCAHIMNVMADGLHNERYRPCPLLDQLVTAGRLGNKTKHGVFDYS